jgi:hypothetical protein
MKPSAWQVGVILFIGVGAVSTAAILIRLAMEAAGMQSVGFSLFLAASRLILTKLQLLKNLIIMRSLLVFASLYILLPGLVLLLLLQLLLLPL